MLKIRTLPIKVHQITLPLLVVLLSTLALIMNSGALTFHREFFIHGEYWRGFTGHFLHTNFNHYILNSSAVILLWALHGQYYNFVNYASVFVFSAITTSVGIYIFSPEITQYVGLSGVLHGLFIWGAIKDIQHKDKTGYILLVAIIVKVIHEQVAGASEDIAALISATVAIDAHLWGMIGGAIIGAVGLLRFYQSKTN